MTNKFTIEPELSFLKEIRKELEKDFKGAKLELYEKANCRKPTVRVYFEIDIESNTPSGIVDEVMDFWNKLRQHFKLEIIKN